MGKQGLGCRSVCEYVYVYIRMCVWYRWYFALLSISGIFSVTFSVVFAYVADVTTEEDRSAAYGLVYCCFTTLAVADSL